MQFSIIRLRHRGRPIPKREWSNRPAFAGDLRVECVYDDELSRHVRFARVVDTVRVVGPDVLPVLMDPVLIAMSPQAFTLAGFERIDGADYAQSWLVTSTAPLWRASPAPAQRYQSSSKKPGQK